MRKLPWKRILLALMLGAAGLVVLCAGVFGPCWTAWAFQGVLLDSCPVGKVRPVAWIEANGLGRKDEGYVTLGVTGHYATEWGGLDTTEVRRFDPTLLLVTPKGEEIALEPEKGWDDGYAHRLDGKVKLPDVPDGDYLLRFTADTPAGEATVDAPLPLYQPALAHVLTDAPLYKPGQEVRFRAVLLGAADLKPLDSRPGTWKVWSPSGDLLLEEKAATAAFGVASGSFPLAPDAESGEWAVAYESGPTSDRVTFTVKPFQLPRFTVEASSPKAYWSMGDIPAIDGFVRYTSGAPVANAPLRVVARTEGAWPPPPEWLEERTLTTDARGAFHVALGVVPADLRGQATVRLSVTATDETGDTATGMVPVLLSEDAVSADAVTELAGGLVPSANNRVYVRTTTPDGKVLAGATVKVTREWDPSDPGVEAVADADGVAKFQLDPGEPTTVVVPPMPVRPRPRAEVVSVRLQSAEDVLSGESVDLLGRTFLDGWAGALGACADRVDGGSENVDVSALVGPDGRVRQVDAFAASEQDALTRCVASRLSGRAAPTGRDRLWSLTWQFTDPGTPSVEADVTTQAGTVDLDEALADRMREARGCVAGIREDMGFSRAFRVGVAAGSTRVSLTPLTDPSLDGRVPGNVASCVERQLSGLALAEPADEGGAGLLRLSVSVPVEPGQSVPAPTTFPGFALRVEVKKDGEALGRTTLRMPVGAVPALRLRFSDVIVDSGATVELTALRGPDYTGGFPEELWLKQGDRDLVKFPFDGKTRKASVTVPPDVDGFVHVEWNGARAVLYVRPKATLALGLSTDARSYRPGETAQLTVTAKDGGKPVGAGVTLSGVDATLATLAPLVGPDDFARVTVRATSDSPAFGTLDARALQTGQIAGDNAAQAAVLRVTGLPTIPPGADRVSIATTMGSFTPDAELADAFYELYRFARTEVRGWESAAPAGEVLTAAKMVELWEKALAAHPTDDPFGRKLHLRALPQDLLALTDPRFMASDGTRLPEDVENWPAYVASEAP